MKLNIINNKRTGALLIELLVVIGISSLLLLTSILYLKQYQPNLKLNSFARQLATDIRYAQQLTVSEQKTYLIKLLQEDKKYQLIKRYEGDIIIKEEKLPLEVDYKQITGFTNNEIIFNNYGAVKEAGTIELVNTNNKTKIISIRPSGYVQF